MFLLANELSSKFPKTLEYSLIAGVLHIVSPAGIFLSAPYSESLFSCLNILGLLVYVKSLKARRQAGLFQSRVLKLVSGALMGCASVIRSNGLFGGTIFAYELVTIMTDILWSYPSQELCMEALTTVCGGSLIALGFMFPQYIAWSQYCPFSSSTTRPVWCENRLPSIYAWVQDHYWSVRPKSILAKDSQTPGTLVFSDTGPYRTFPCFCLHCLQYIYCWPRHKQRTSLVIDLLLAQKVTTGHAKRHYAELHCLN